MMSCPSQPKERQHFEIAIICALQLEADAVEAMFDRFWDDDGDIYGKAPGDPNAYTTGVIGRHNVVLAYMHGIGKGSAASVASSFRSSFDGIKLALVVGICGGVPNGTDDEKEVLLGDVIVSTGIVEFDFGRQLPNQFIRKDTLQDSLGRPNSEIRSLLAKLKSYRSRTRLIGSTSYYLSEVQQKLGVGKAQYPGIDADKLFESTYRHKHHDSSACTLCTKYEKKEDEVCQTALDSSCLELKCSEGKLVPRSRLSKIADITSAQNPVIHYGLIASGDTVMKSGEDRDTIAAKEKVIAFEMEGAGVWDNFPCIVIKGVCDYADSHKNKEWQNYAAATAAAFMKAFLKEWVPTEKSIVASHILPKAHWLVPFGRNRNFVGRESQLSRLLAKFNTKDTEENCQRIALVGLGGIGKTQVALEFAFKIHELFPEYSVFWVSAIDATTFEQAYRKIGQQLQIPGIDDDQAAIKELVKARLSQESAGKWVIIVDNADDVEMLAILEYLPFSLKGAILFTTRDRKAATKYASSNVIAIEDMTCEESRELLKKALQNPRLIEDKNGTSHLLRLLVNLPLAIMQAAAYLNENSTTIARYLKIYEGCKDGFIKLLSKNFEDEGRYPGLKHPVITTWLISFNQVRHRDVLAADYLAFMSCINPQGIPEHILPPASLDDATEALGTLKAFAFIKERSEGLYDMHQLVQIATRNWLKSEGELIFWSRKTLLQVAKVFPYPENQNRATWMMYLPHAQNVLGIQEYSSVFEKSQRYLLCKVGGCLRINGRYKDAEQIYRLTVELCEKVSGKENPLTLMSMNNLAQVLSDQGKYAEAEAMHLQTLKLIEKLFGKEHPSTLKSMNNLARVLNNQGKLEKAEEIHRQTLELMEKVLGKEYPDTLTSMSNLALVLSHQGKYIEAEEMHRQTLELREKVLGKEHPDMLTSMNNLAAVLDRQGKYIEAEEMHRQTLELMEKVIGKEHPNTLMSMNNLATVLGHQRKYIEAEEIHRQTLELMEKVLGKEHPDTLTSMRCLASLRQRQR